jgi:hypothetical protein
MMYDFQAMWFLMVDPYRVTKQLGFEVQPPQPQVEAVDGDSKDLPATLELVLRQSRGQYVVLAQWGRGEVLATADTKCHNASLST